MTEGAATHPWAETCHLVPPGSSWGVHGPMNNCHRGSFCLGLGGGVSWETFTQEMRQLRVGKNLRPPVRPLPAPGPGPPTQDAEEHRQQE